MKLTIDHWVTIVAACAANLALVTEIGRTHGTGAWRLGALILGTSAVFVLIVSAALRLRAIPILAMLTTSALTEALLWRSVSNGHSASWVRDYALVGVILIGLVLVASRSLRRGVTGRTRRSDGPDDRGPS